MSCRFEAVLFDLFDTLCHLNEEIYLEGKRVSATRLGLDPERYLEEWMAIQEPCQRGEIPTLGERVRTVCHRLGCEVDPKVREEVEANEKEVLKRCAGLHVDVLPTLQRVRSRPGLRTALVSNASGSARALMDHLGLVQFFEVLVFSFETGSLKPEPAIYEAACARLGVEAGRCLFVGDGNGQELEGAMQLGMTAVRIERPGALKPYRRNPSRHWHHSIENLEDLIRFL